MSRAFLQFVIGDWYFAYPMFALSLVGLALLLWRILLNTYAGTRMDQFLPEFQTRLEEDGIEGELELCRSAGPTSSPPALRRRPGKRQAGSGGDAPGALHGQRLLELEILPDLNFLLPPILAIAKVATMVGLLGTVLSMIGVFTEIQQSGGGNPAQQSGKIGLAALFARTALGLVTAIPLAFAHVLLKRCSLSATSRSVSSPPVRNCCCSSRPPAPARAPPTPRRQRRRPAAPGQPDDVGPSVTPPCADAGSEVTWELSVRGRLAPFVPAFRSLNRALPRWPRNRRVCWTSGSSRPTPSTGEVPYTVASPTGCSKAVFSWRTTSTSSAHRARRTGLKIGSVAILAVYLPRAHPPVAGGPGRGRSSRSRAV